ncbi:MAG: NYN domain-containing protein [Chloroflexi bacterium]|uniref:NYN domain-containing protein n=1 Tax=Candidatus Chlorohelix allophototropha TaxID=3003348 RepID=A0A8T7M7K9_9CHLR|nr:NYN domain-containing protein [Chloroflexota bacterium]WJW67982.1 NYN domain-containing protein [Chloroflexota bacterium L227-S17]
MAIYPNIYNRKEEETDQVALFIDWDNLVISNYADRGSNRPNLDVLIAKAQSYGTLVLARAYAEWSNTVDRLEVYKAGVETVYAPVFHADRDLSGQTGKGKSLADPVMVTDCVDFLHLMPSVRTYVLVTGDKDMMPVVRLAKMRGRRVVVVGPDYVANVLQQICDEFVPYRVLLAQASLPSDPYAAYYQGVYSQQSSAQQYYQQQPTPPQNQQQTTVVGRNGRRLAGNRRGTPPPTSVGQPYMQVPIPQQQQPSYPAPTAYTGQYQPATSGNYPVVTNSYQPVQQPQPQPVQAPVQAVPVVTTPPPAPTKPAASTNAQATSHASNFEDIKEVIRNILSQRSTSGRAQMRARDLKEDLLRRIPSFNERRYGFSKFKALLSALELANILQMDQIGHILWVSMPGTPRMDASESGYDDTDGVNDGESSIDMDSEENYEVAGEETVTEAVAETAENLSDDYQSGTPEVQLDVATEAPAPVVESEEQEAAAITSSNRGRSVSSFHKETSVSPFGPKPTLLDQPHFQEVIVLIEGLRHRNRWLGYELLLSNVRDYLNKHGMNENEAKSHAGTILSRLLSEGVLKMAVEVHSRGARKMRVQVAHLQEDHKAVKYAMLAAAEAQSHMEQMPDELNAAPMVAPHPEMTATQEIAQDEIVEQVAEVESAPEIEASSPSVPDTFGYFGLLSYSAEPLPELPTDEVDVAEVEQPEQVVEVEDQTEEGVDDIEVATEEGAVEDEVMSADTADSLEATPRPRRRPPLRVKLDMDGKPFPRRRRPIKIPHGNGSENAEGGNSEN